MGTLRELIDHASGFAESLFAPDDEMWPHFVAEAADGSITVATLAVEGAELDLMRKALGLRFEREGQRRWVFFAEGWKSEPARGGHLVDPQDDPERIEVVLFDAFDAAGNRRVRGSRQILRIEGQPARLLPLVITRGPTFDAPTRPSRMAR